uniref:SCO-spondin n=1 Tax=Electrophorus electricus TaxID=8005 RepID=A0A4W4HMF9_ELEEL
MKALFVFLLGLHLVIGIGHWCEHTVEEKLENIISPRLQLEVECSEVYQYNTQGWRLDVDRMKHIHGGDDGIALYFKSQGPKASCYLYKAANVVTERVNRTVRACCEGWTGPGCSHGASVRGLCFSTWSCDEFPGIQNSSLMALEQCCGTLWGLSWRNASDQTCLSCSYTPLPDSEPSPIPRRGLLGRVRDPKGSATCLSWGGVHYRTFDRKHFHFQGSCTYVLASSSDGTWAVYISSVCDGGGHCSKALRMMMGLDRVSVLKDNISLNGLILPQEQPVFQKGVSIHWLGDFVFVESGLGVRVKFDMDNTVYLTVTAEHFAATRGLCGIYNNIADDDFSSRNGNVSPYAASFGNSWRVPDPQTEGCSDAAELGHSCDITGDISLRREAESICHQLKESPFWHCHHWVDPGPYLEACLYVYCSMDASEREGAVCDTLASYARECAQQHVILSWRGPGLCERVCPGGQLFSDCVSSCPPSCSSTLPPIAGQCREECVGGCECPLGLFLHGGQCIRREDCPCFHRRRTYQEGDAIKQRCNTCVCRAGQWQCSAEKCAAQCSIIGAMQITTFDKKMYNLQADDCQFIAVEDFVDKKLAVTIRGGMCVVGGGPGCLQELSITALHTTVTITNTGSLMLNGQQEDLPILTADVAVHRASSSFLLIQVFGAQLLWQTDGPLLLITLEPSFAHKVRGLCGTLTWNQHDDFTTPEGDVENSVSSFAAKFSFGSCPLPSAVTSDPCSTYTQRRQYAERICDVLHSPVFQMCHDVVEREPYMRLCLSEVCSCAPHRSCQCTVLTAYAHRCAQEGVLVSWRNHTFCPMHCSGGQVYQECGRPCGGTCADLAHGWSCDEVVGSRSCVPGCQCPVGLAQDQHGQCVPLSMCPCTRAGVVHPPGSSVQISCNTCVCGHGVWNCTDHPCAKVSECPGSLVFSPRSCLRTCANVDSPHAPCAEPLYGCVCPEGTVLLGDHCVSPDECPCHHNGQIFFTNDTISKDCNTCVCKQRRWHCTQSLCAGMCVATGDPHYVTFDGRCFSFLGDCEYVLAQEMGGLFSVSAENVPCGSTGVTCTKSVTLTIGNTAIHLLRGKAVTVNGMAVTLPKSYSGSGLFLERVGLFVSLSSRLGVTLLWDGGMRVYLQLAAHLRGRVAGLCGNFDGDAENDFTTRQGIMESTPELFGNSWKVSPSCPDVTEQDLRDPCTINPHRVTWAKKKCAVIMQELFSPCHAEVPYQQYYDWCVFDACGCDSGGDCECLCTAVATYAEECNHRGIYIRWRSQELCPLQCDDGLVYEACGPACSAVCPGSAPSSDSRCSALSCVEGCFCPYGTIRHGDSCISPSECPCEWNGSLFPPGTAVTQHCQNCSCSNGTWQCSGPACPPSVPCLESEFQCPGTSHRCIPSLWLCDNEDDCGDGSDEFCPSTCPPGQFRCSGGVCLPVELHCNGHPDCADQSDEEFCCGMVCAEGEFRCSSGRCLRYLHRCDGHDDCGDFSDERGCVCAPGEFQCPSNQCVSAERVCDGHKDCSSGIDEVICPVKGMKLTLCNSGCSQYEFGCASGQCVPLGWRCDGETDCLDGSDEKQCARTCAPDQVLCLSGDQCVQHAHLTSPAPPGGSNISHTCPEFTCMDGSCVPFKLADCPDADLIVSGGPSDEQGCQSWAPWGPWSPCSHTCGAGTMSRHRHCPLGDTVGNCRGENMQRQQCYSIACPVDGHWSPWTTWSNCSKGCGGVELRHRVCVPPQNGGGRACVGLSSEIKPCPQEVCANISCPAGLVTHTCAPCPKTCVHVSSGTSCDPSAQCFTGCWCPEGKVMNHLQQCVLPEECVCEVSGVLYWPGQQVKMGCEICRCERGRPQHCEANPECSVHCGWSSWSPWGECLGPCGVQSVQWSFRSPNNPSKYGNGRQCRGIYRKARRCQTQPCEECEYQGHTHAVGDRWKGDQCQLCHCLPNLTVQCAPFCTYAATGCPQVCRCMPGWQSFWRYINIPTTPPALLTTVVSSTTPGGAPFVPTFPLPPGDECWAPLGVQSLPASSFNASSQQLNHPASAGWSPEPEQYRELAPAFPHSHASRGQAPYLQIDLLRAYNITGLLTQGGGLFDTFVSSFYLQFSSDGSDWFTYKEPITDARPKAKMFLGNHDDRGVAQTRLDRVVLARLVRVLPHDFQNGIYLRVELMGCGGGACTGREFRCGNGRCVPAGPQGVLCDGVNDCGDGSDELSCGKCTVSPTGLPGLQNQTALTGSPGYREYTSGPPGLYTMTPQAGYPGVATVSPIGTGIPGTGPQEPTGEPGLSDTTTSHDGGLPRVLCVEGQFACKRFGCVDTGLVCDGQEDCPDGSDEDHCVTPTRHPLVPSPCSAKQFTCGSGECVHLNKKCDLQKDCADGSDESDCVDCVLSAWTAWSQCSVSCGLGSLFRQREILRDARAEGSCGGAQFDSRACFLQACPVDGQWSEWSEWSECDATCGGGLRRRSKSCSNPPPKNNGQVCKGMTMQTQSCNTQPCGTSTDSQTGCANGQVLVTEADCAEGRVEPCPLTCSALHSERNCSTHCVTGCRCPAGLFLQDHSCVNASRCICLWEGLVLQPGKEVIKDNCTTCVCRGSHVACDNSSCIAKCDWSAWSSWTSCDSSCGIGIQQRFRYTEPLFVEPCVGDSTEARQCSTPCPPGLIPAWTVWSECSKTCFHHVNDVGMRHRFRSCNNTESSAPCVGEAEEQEPCNTFHCPVSGGWSAWSAWSACSSECDSGAQTRERFCSSPPPLYGGSICLAHSLRDFDLGTTSQPCVCPVGMSYLSKEQCQVQGGACPRVCLDVTASAECATECYDGCYCSPGLYLFNNTCVHLSHCPCFHEGVLYSQGDSVPHDACNNCTCINGDMRCGTKPCPVDCGWSEWTSWSACSRTCDVGIRRRYRSGTNPSQAFGGRPCEGDRIGLDTCSLYPCSGVKGPWSAWSECSVPCGGGYRNRTRGLVRSHGTPQQFSACNLQPCGGTVCAAGQEWTECIREVLLCSDLSMDTNANFTCSPGCHCPLGSALQDGSCVPLPLCRCDVDGEQYGPGTVVTKDCIVCVSVCVYKWDIPSVDGGWSAWTPWGVCSASCGAGLQSRYRFCSSPERAGTGLPCLGPEREDHVCAFSPCSRHGGWSEWTSWTDCTKTCGEGVRSRRRECDRPVVGGEGDFCEGLRTELIACNTDHCPVAPCSAVPGTAFSSCGPSCPRSCDELAYCKWHCEPGCYCTNGKVLNHNSTACVEREQCPCLDLSTGRRIAPGDTVLSPDGCNNCTCDGGQLTCSHDPCPVHGGWCEWSSWTPCSKTCGAEWVSRYRSCACPESRSGGAACPGLQEVHGGLGVQIQRQPCPSITFCPVHGSWGLWSAWSECDACAGVSLRKRECNSPPARFGGLPCHSERLQSRGCHDNWTVCTDCGGGQEEWPCGKPCPRSCEDFHGDTECVDTPGCSRTCGCPGDMVLQDGVCVEREECHCKFHNSTTESLNINNTSWEWPDKTGWQYVNSGESIIRDCSNCTCEAGILHCDSVPGCLVDGDTGPWSDWSVWSVCSVTCGGGEQGRTRSCRTPPCTGMTRQSKTCNTHVCLEVGCPPGRLYRECERGEGCPFSCAQLSGLEGCYSEGCEEGCHCPLNTYQHHGACLQECPCLVDKELLSALQRVSANPESTLDLQNVTMGTELWSGEQLMHECSTCLCQHGRWNCSLVPCPRDGGLSPWGPWGSCSLSCGGLGQKVRNRGCTQPSPAHGGHDCLGPLQETMYCQTPDCPNEDLGFSQWTSWSACSKSCSDVGHPSLKTRMRECVSAPCSGQNRQQRVCNLSQCPDGGVCVGEVCAHRNCSWVEWGEWGVCSRSCGVGQQQRFRTFLAPGVNGTWCPDILGGNVEHRFCNIRACRVDGSWSRWSPWSLCDQSCGGGRSIRTRSCSSPPPKNGGHKCVGEKNQVKPCNTKPCDDKGCPLGQEFVPCANECPQRCSDLQQGIQCQASTECQAGCRCPRGELQQDGVCVKPWQCDCVDALGQSWAAGSQHEVACNNCSCTDGVLSCTNRSCTEESDCSWSSWSSWAPCSTTCGSGQRTRFRSLIPESPDADCHFEEVQHKPCDLGLCPPLCLHGNEELSVGDTWLQGECKQCTCIPEGEYCQEIDCQVDGGWTPWSMWSDCTVTCGRGGQVRSRACVNPPPRNNGTNCFGPEREAQNCHVAPCLDDVCPWSRWSVCSRSCGAGVVSRRRQCVCEEEGDHACPTQTEAERNREDTQLCYRRPCPDCPMSEWTEWTSCSCVSPLQLRYRAPLTSATRGQHCTELERQSKPCKPQDYCVEPFQPECGSPCEKQCVLHGQLCVFGSLQGLMQQNSTCITLEQCGCVYLLQQDSGVPVPITVPQGALVTLGCSTCLCHDGSLQCDSRECEVSLSEWSEWTPCSRCIPASSLLHPGITAGLGGGVGVGVHEATAALVSVQRRYRACLDMDSGLPVSTRKGECSKPLEEERFCPQLDVCKDPCQWSVWGPWSVCQEPCSGGFRQRERKALALPFGAHCTRQQHQSQSCNTALCPGERCEDRGRVYEAYCANQCPRSCADLWEHVQCLQGACHPGCRCPDGWLLQDRECVRVSACRCGLPMENSTLELTPGQNVTVSCNTCVCMNGSLVCTDRTCPVYGPWGSWSECSVSCGTGQRTRTRPCTHIPGGPSCVETIQNQTCTLPACPECPVGQVFSLCAGSCPLSCQDLWPWNQCVAGRCIPGCTCPPNTVMLNGSCVAHSACPCSSVSLLLRSPSMSLDGLGEEFPPGTVVPHLCNACMCENGVFNCTEKSCNVCPEGERWRRSVSESTRVCERACVDIYSAEPLNCSQASGVLEGCVCEEGHYRRADGQCVIPALCQCEEEDGTLQEPGSEWKEECDTCRCINGLKQCKSICTPLLCEEGEVKVMEAAQCCPVCRKEYTGEPLAHCHRHTEVRNITKGDCRLDNVEVSFCRGRCLSGTDVILEEPYLQAVCDCCSYRLDPQSPVRFLSLRCTSGESEPVVLPVIHSCECTSCQGGDLSKR